MKVYENLGIKSDDVLEMQKWLFPQLVDKKIKSISDIIISINKKYPAGVLRDYAIYVLGYNIGGARLAEKKGIMYAIDPENI